MARERQIGTPKLPRPYLTTMSSSTEAGGHVFLSYVREDRDLVDRLQETLEAAGIAVWRDTASLWPGEDWRAKIRQAITNDALVFIACFSSRSLAKTKSYQNEELVLAIEELRKRRPDQPWLIPVRLDDCTIPYYDLGAGRALSDLHRVDFFGETTSTHLARLLSTVLRLLGVTTDNGRLPLAVRASEQIKAMLPLPERAIALDDLVAGLADRCAETLTDQNVFPSAWPSGAVDGTRFLVDQAHRYLDTTLPVAEALVSGCAFGDERHNALWQRVVETIGGTASKFQSGAVPLLELRRLALLPVLFGGALGAVARQNWSALLSVTLAPQVRSENREKVPAVSLAHAWGPFANAEVAASVLALEVAAGAPLPDDQIAALRSGHRGKLYTPVSDTLHDVLRPLLRPLIRDDEDYHDVFDETEVLLAILATISAQRARADDRYQAGGWYGSFTWRRRYDRGEFEQRVWTARRDNLVAAGAFDAAAGDVAFQAFAEEAAMARSRRF